VQLGYDHVLPSRFLVGVEGDITFPYFAEDGVIVSRAAPQGSVTEKLDFVSTLCGRIGYALDSWLLYGTGGLAWSQARFGETSAATGATSAALSWRGGWTAGAGAEVVIAPAWTVRAEYLLEHLEGSSAALPAGPRFESSATTIHDVRLALNWHFGFPGEPPATPGLAGDGWWLDPASWNAHWQATLVEQGYLGFRSPYEGANSLSGSTQFRNTLSATAFLGLRLWEGGQLYVNPEVDQGYGLSETLGVAAFPNGEAQKASYPVPRLNIDRVIVRQTFGLGGERALVQDAPNQLPGVRDVSRITLTAGRLSVGDAFGLNAYADDPRTQFLNWNIYGSGSYDWTMDRPGFTWGALVELNQARWALRAGYFLEPTESNGNSFDTDVPTHGQYLVEPEVRYAAFSQPGILRLMAWATRANMGSYSEAVAMPVTASGYPDIAQTRQVRGTYGFVANVEQALSRDVGVFSRASWTPGLVEVMGWTDCDESLSVGTLVTGAVWRRPGDRLGVAGVVEGLSKEARAYFAAGGLGIVIGDGRLDYRPEQVLEVFYAMGLASWATLTADVQLLANPGYNADRGPVPIYALRLHAER
jgi:high affinity Mn2+ porin